MASVPQSMPGTWRTYGEASIAGSILTVGQVGDTENGTQPNGFHGASIALAPADSYAFTFEVSLATWDSYNDSYSGGSGTGFWDSFSISVTNLPYDTLQLTNDPLQFPFVWGGPQWGDGVLATFTDNELTLTFAGDGENTKYLNLVLDTGNPPEADQLYPSWGTFTLPPLPPMADLDISHVTTGFVPEADEVNKGGLVAVLEDDADHLLKQANGDWNQPHTRFVVSEISGIPVGAVLTLSFGSHLVVKQVLPNGGEQMVISGVTEIDPGSDSLFIAYGTTKSTAELDTEVKLVLNGGGFVNLELDKVRVTVVDAFFEVNLTTFIPMDYVDDPGNIIWGPDSVFEGDNRGFNRTSADFRTRQLLMITPFVEFDIDGVLGDDKYVGETVEYDKATSIDPNDPTKLLAAAKAEIQIEANKGAPYKIDWGTASGNTLAWQNVATPTSTNRKIQVRLLGDENNPLVASPGITYDVQVTIDANSSILVPQFTISGNHDGFPAYEIYIDETSAYTHDPRATGDGLGSLFAPMEYTVNENGTID